MATAIDVGRQSVLVAKRDFTYDDFTSGTAKAMIYLKPGTTILRGYVDITTAFNSATADAIVVGDTYSSTDDVDRYVSSLDAQATGVTSFSARTTGTTGVPSQEISTAEALTMTWTGTGTAASAGAGTIVIEYIEDERTTEFHTYRG